MVLKRVIALCIITINFWGMPVYADQVHRVSINETISGIAQHYGITTDSLIGNNQYITNPDFVYPGQVLIIPNANRQSYLVKPGDTLSEISRNFGISMAILANINNIFDWDNLSVDQVLLIPKLYTVKAGDTLYGISRTIGVEMEDLSIENNLTDINKLYIGQSLIIPFRSSEREELADVEKELTAIANRFPDTFFYKGQPGGRKIALTFDDGPDKTATDEVLDLLKQYDVPATFFLLGTNMPAKSDIVKRIIAEGHTIANHTTTHSNLRALTEDELMYEMITLENEIQNITGLRTALMRPPYGFVTDNNLRQLNNMNYKVIKWTVDTKDWRDMDIDKVLINTLPNVRDGSIILMHDYLTQSVTKEVLPEIIQSLKYQGYTFVTVDELIGIKAYK
jgi:peptidoglycan-N-acetylglucosamine deacetylase